MEAILETKYALDTFYFLVSGALVMWMAAGFAMLEAGLVRSKNVTMQLTKNIALFSIPLTDWFSKPDGDYTTSYLDELAATTDDALDAAVHDVVRAQVEAPSGRPRHVRSALANGAIVHCAGPWRTTGRWWSEDRFAFDHYDVQTRDGWVFRLRRDHVARTWAIDAIYD